MFLLIGYYRGLHMGYYIRDQETDSSSIINAYVEKGEKTYLFYNLENDQFLMQSETLPEGIIKLKQQHPEKTIVISQGQGN